MDNINDDSESLKNSSPTKETSLKTSDKSEDSGSISGENPKGEENGVKSEPKAEENAEDGLRVVEESDKENLNIDILRDTIVGMSIESWRFASAYERILSKIDAGEQQRYYSQYRWFLKKTENYLSRVGLKIVSVIGREYDTGMPVTPINIEDFEKEDTLIVEQMLEPIIVDDDGFVRPGIITLRKKQ
jgi:hypothetical protein